MVLLHSNEEQVSGCKRVFAHAAFARNACAAFIVSARNGVFDMQWKNGDGQTTGFHLFKIVVTIFEVLVHKMPLIVFES